MTGIDRRDFLAGAAATGVVLQLPASPPPAEPVAEAAPPLPRTGPKHMGTYRMSGRIRPFILDETDAPPAGPSPGSSSEPGTGTDVT